MSDEKEKKEKKEKPMWLLFDVRLDFINKVMGGAPLDSEVMAKMLDVKREGPLETGQVRAEDYAEDRLENSSKSENENGEEVEETTINGFVANDDGHLMAFDYQVKAHIKECARILASSPILRKMFGATGKYVPALKKKTADRVYVKPLEFPFVKIDGEPVSVDGYHARYPHRTDVIPVTEVDGQIKRFIRIPLPKGGEASAIKISQFIDKPSLEFKLKVLNDGFAIKESFDVKQYLTHLFEYGGEHGMFAERSLGYGRYVIGRFESEEDTSPKQSPVENEVKEEPVPA